MKQKLSKIAKHNFQSAYLWAKYTKTYRRLPNPLKPTTFNGNIVWRMIHDRDPRLQDIADKIAVREHVTQRLGEEALIPLLHVFDSVEAFRKADLPPAFVIKASFGSKMTHVCKSFTEADRPQLERLVTSWLKREYDEPWLQWLYGKHPKRVIVEKLMRGPTGEVPEDYKFFTFRGEPRFVQVDVDRFNGHKRALVTPDFERIPCDLQFPSSGDVCRPAVFDQMTDAARRLADGFSFLRVDLYDVDGRVTFGELTPFPGRGSELFTPDKYDQIFGKHFAA